MMAPSWVNDKVVITTLLTLFSLNAAFIDVITDALTVSQARRDPKYGSEDLNSYGYIWMSIGGIIGSLIAAFLT